MCKQTNMATESLLIYRILLLPCQWWSMAACSYRPLFCVINITEYLITYSMEHSPPLDAKLFSTSQEIPHILWKPKVHYGVHNCPLPVTLLIQINPVHAPTTNVLNIHPNILPSMPGSSKWLLSLRFPHWKPLCTVPPPISVTCPVHLILLDFIIRIIFGEECRSLNSSSMIFSTPLYLVPLMSKYSPQHPILKQPQATFLLQCKQPSFTLIQNTRHNYCSVYLHFYIWIANWKIKYFAQNESKHSLSTTCSWFLPG